MADFMESNAIGKAPDSKGNPIMKSIEKAVCLVLNEQKNQL